VPGWDADPFAFCCPFAPFPLAEAEAGAEDELGLGFGEPFAGGGAEPGGGA
jgi:hypothetical protein